MMQRETHTTIAVLGAGLTGMSAALHLDRDRVPRRLFEKLERAGGHVITALDSGYRFDRTGHLLHLKDDALKADVMSWLGGASHVLEIDRRSRIWSSGVYTRYPFQANTFGLPPEVASECLLGFLRAHFSKPEKAPKNFEEFCLATFGEGFSRRFMIPYNARLWGVSPTEITAEWCARFVPIPKLEDVVAGAVGLNDRELGYNAKFLYPRRGIGELSSGLAQATGDIELGRAPKRIDWRGRKMIFEDESVGYESLIATAPLPTLVGLLDEPPQEVLEAAARLRCTHLYYLDVALNTRCEKDLHWVYVPEEKYPFYRVGCYSNFSSEMAPIGKANLYVELADRSEPKLAEVLPVVADGLVEMGIIRAREAIRFARVRRIDHAYVIFDEAYAKSVATVHAFLDGERIVSAGRYGGWNYSSMEDALIFGRDAARKAKAMT